MDGLAMSADSEGKKTKTDWFYYVTDKVIPFATKLWFDWVEWVLILGALQYLLVKSSSWVVALVLLISYTLFGLYFGTYIQNQLILLSTRNIPVTKLVPRLLSILLAAVISFGMFIVLRVVIFQVAAHKE
jgi:hypothetical protein